MHNKDRYPEIWVAKERCENELVPYMERRKEYQAQIKELRREIDELEAKYITPLRDKQYAIRAKMDKDVDKVRELRKEQCRLARAMKGVHLSGESG